MQRMVAFAYTTHMRMQHEQRDLSLLLVEQHVVQG